MSENVRKSAEARLVKLGLIGTFLAAIATAGSATSRRPSIGPFELGVMGLASHRIGRMMAYERVAAPLREPFTATVRDSTGVDETVVARGKGAQWVFGELVSCPTCVATWAALGMYLGLTVLPGPTRALMHVLAAVGVSELVNGAVEQLEWSSRAARRHAG